MTELIQGKFYRGNFIGCAVTIPTLPQSIVINGTLLSLKSEFYVTILGAADLILLAKEQGLSVSQFQIEKAFEETLERYPVSFKEFKQEFRYVEEDGNASVVVICSVSNLKEFFDELESNLGILVPLQPTHVTIYTKQPNKGIGVSTIDAMKATKDVTTDVPKEIRDAFQYFSQ